MIPLTILLKRSMSSCFSLTISFVQKSTAIGMAIQAGQSIRSIA